jgi:hypothetical protein
MLFRRRQHPTSSRAMSCWEVTITLGEHSMANSLRNGKRWPIAGERTSSLAQQAYVLAAAPGPPVSPSPSAGVGVYWSASLAAAPVFWSAAPVCWSACPLV